MIYIIIAMWLFVAFQIYFEYQEHHGKSGMGIGVTKTIGSVLFVIAGILSDVHLQPAGPLLLTGLLLSLVGDVLLVPKSRTIFRIGIISFLLAHVAYCAAFISMKGHWMVTVGAVPVMIAVGVLVGRWLLPSVEAKMKKPVIAYIATICTMVSLSAGMAITGNWHFTVAAVIFMISDIFVARDRFVESTFQNRLWGLPLYYGAQLLLATSPVIAITPGSP